MPLPTKSPPTKGTWTCRHSAMFSRVILAPEERRPFHGWSADREAVASQPVVRFFSDFAPKGRRNFRTSSPCRSGMPSTDYLHRRVASPGASLWLALRLPCPSVLAPSLAVAVRFPSLALGPLTFRAAAVRACCPIPRIFSIEWRRWFLHGGGGHDGSFAAA